MVFESPIKFLSGGPGPTARKQPGRFFLVLSLSYSLQRGPMVLLQRKLSKHIPGGSSFFRGGGGVQMLISIEAHITCDFPAGGGGGGGVRIPYPPFGSAHGIPLSLVIVLQKRE